MTSPDFFANKIESSTSEDNGNENWVVAYGYSNDKEAQELHSILKEYGRILSTKSNGNWIAAQYSDDLSAVRASARQIVRVGHNLCGISRTSNNVLKELVAQNCDASKNLKENGWLTTGKISVLGEEDILAGSADERWPVFSKSQPKSICEKVFYWYFDWELATENLHED